MHCNATVIIQKKVPKHPNICWWLKFYEQFQSQMTKFHCCSMLNNPRFSIKWLPQLLMQLQHYIVKKKKKCLPVCKSVHMRRRDVAFCIMFELIKICWAMTDMDFLCSNLCNCLSLNLGRIHPLFDFYAFIKVLQHASCVVIGI